MRLLLYVFFFASLCLALPECSGLHSQGCADPAGASAEVARLQLRAGWPLHGFADGRFAGDVLAGARFLPHDRLVYL